MQALQCASQLGHLGPQGSHLVFHGNEPLIRAPPGAPVEVAWGRLGGELYGARASQARLHSRFHGWTCRRYGEQLHPALLLLARTARQAQHEGLLPCTQALQVRVDGADPIERRHPLGSGPQLASGLWSSQKQHGDQRQLTFVESEALTEDMAITGHGAPVRGIHEPNQAGVPQRRDRHLDDVLAIGDDRLPIRGLVTRHDQGVEGKGVLLWGGQLLLDEAADNPTLLSAQLHGRILRACARRHGRLDTVDTDQADFERLVADALDLIPEALGRMMENVVVVVEDWPTAAQLDGRRGTLLGLYQGIDLTRRSPLSYAGVMPDRITIFRGPINRLAGTEAELVAMVTTTVIHEVAHHFGISDARLEELGWA